MEGLLKHGKDRGCKREVRGYFGDMSVGPWTTLGVEVADRTAPHANAFLDIADKGHATERRKHNATEISMYNLIALLFGMETLKRYELSVAGSIFSGLGGYLQSDRDALAQAEAIVETLDGVTIVPLTGDLAQHLAKLPPLDVVDAGTMAVDKLATPAMKASVKPGGVVFAETAQYLVPLKAAEREAFSSKVHEFGVGQGWTPRYAVVDGKPAAGAKAPALVFDC